MSLTDRLFKRLEREFVKAKARQRADKKAAARRMRRITSSHLAETSPSDVMEGVKETPIINPISEQPEELSLPGVRLAILNASKAKKHKGRKAKNSSFCPPPPLQAPITVEPLPAPPAAPTPFPPPPPPQTPALAAAPHLERKIARLEAELLSRDRSWQKRNDAFHSPKTSEHQKMLELMDARPHINGLEAKLERVEKKLEVANGDTVSWVHRAEKFKANNKTKLMKAPSTNPFFPRPTGLCSVFLTPRSRV